MKMWSADVIILLLFCYACLSTGDGEVRFVSKNFHNVLHWDAVEPTSAGEQVLYSVQYQRYAGEQFQMKQECQNISALTCDLTAETPSVPDVHYNAKVLVNGRMLGRTSARFKPIAETTLGAPNLSTHATVSSLFVNVTLPLGPNGVSMAEIINNSKSGPSQTVIEYTLKITEPKWAELVSEGTTGHFVINLKNNRTKYCGHVVYKPFSEWGRALSEEASFCVTLPDNPQMLSPWLFAIAALLVAVVTMSVAWTCYYVKGGKKTIMPRSLVTSSTSKHQVLQSPDGRIIISTPVVCSPSDKSGGYSPQDMPFQAWQDSTGTSEDNGEHSPTSNHLETSGQSSEIYSSVAVHIPQQFANTETWNLPSRSEPWDKGGLKPVSPRVPPLLDACESNAAIPLLLHTVRDANGQLMLPSLNPQLQSCTGDSGRTPLLSSFIDSKEERPLLASLHSFDSSDWSDSGCDDGTANTPTQPYANSHYIASHTSVPHVNLQCQNAPSCDATFESGYKQNWTPEILHEAASKDICGYTWTNYRRNWTPPKEEEEEEGEEDDDRGEERSRQIGLGSWLVQLQE
ncbi:interferon lambda receptor 1 [Hippoglossus hippoglossus]|uniref:interferon lambda receptor 1 n=1 Tax=Hippoglossus hippoglossus TaxID=8267 RepID=UPI00148CDBA4|nr:interferon lambda receptor 1 [Hippoglossus hippoglossus]